MAKYDDFNVCVFTGRLFADPEIRFSQNGETKIAEFSLAVNKRSKNDDEKPNSLRISAFNKTAEFAEKYLKKGSKVLIRSRVDTGEYTNKDGVKSYYTKFIASSVQFAESKKTGEEGLNIEDLDTPSGVSSDDGFINVPDGIEEELPFA